MKKLIDKIKSKKPLDRLDDKFVEDFIEEFLKKNPKLKIKYLNSNIKKKDFELIFKSIRSELNRIYGQFWTGNHFNIKSHKSTAERQDSYKNLYKFIFSITGNPKTLLDLAGGMNCITYNLIGKNTYFYAQELTDYDCNNISSYFKKNNIKGEVIKSDLRYFNSFPAVDVCFMFKILDVLENKGHKIAEKLINNINAKFIIASFSTHTIRGNKMNYPRRGWFDRMLKRLKLKFIIHYEYNEVFYIIEK